MRLGGAHGVVSGDGGVDGLDEVFEFEGAVVALVVDEEGGCAVDAAADAADEVAFDF